MERRPARHARMRIYTRIGVFRLLGTVFGTTAWHELSPKFERKYQADKCDGKGDDSTAKEQESARSKLVLELVPLEIDEIPPWNVGFQGLGTREQEYTKKTFIERIEGRGSTDTLIRTRIIYRDSLFCLFLRSIMGWVAPRFLEISQNRLASAWKVTVDDGLIQDFALRGFLGGKKPIGGFKH